MDRDRKKSFAMLELLRDGVRRIARPSAADYYAAAALLGCAAFGFASLAPAASQAPEPAIAALDLDAAQAPVRLDSPLAIAAPSMKPETPHAQPVSAQERDIERSLPRADGSPSFEYDVEYFWPREPQTVPETVQVRARPDSRAPIVYTARPGERLRVNGRIDLGASDWLRVRLPQGRDGYLVEDTVTFGEYRRIRAAARAEAVRQQAEAAAAAALQEAALAATAPQDNSNAGDSVLPLF